MIITTSESFSPQEIRPFPKAQPRKTQKGGRKRRKSTILDDTPIKIALEDKTNSAKTREATEPCKKLISNKEPVSSLSSKLETAKKGLKKGKDTRIQAKKSNDNEKFKIDLVCCEHFGDSRPGDDCVQCMTCKHWAHELCTTEENIFNFISYNCDSETDLDRNPLISCQISTLTIALQLTIRFVAIDLLHGAKCNT